MSAGVDVVGIDEAQFFDEVSSKSAAGWPTTACGSSSRDSTWTTRANPSARCPRSWPRPNMSPKVHAICVRCGNLAHHSHRLTSDDKQVMLGAQDTYEPICRHCFKELVREKKNNPPGRDFRRPNPSAYGHFRLHTALRCCWAVHPYPQQTGLLETRVFRLHQLLERDRQASPQPTEDPVRNPQSPTASAEACTAESLALNRETEKTAALAESPQPSPELLPAPESSPGPEFSHAPERKGAQTPPRRRKNYEKFIGTQLFAAIGIFVLIVGIGFFIKYAINNDWLDERMRTGLGLRQRLRPAGSGRPAAKALPLVRLAAGGRSICGILCDGCRSLPLL